MARGFALTFLSIDRPWTWCLVLYLSSVLTAWLAAIAGLSSWPLLYICFVALSPISSTGSIRLGAWAHIHLFLELLSAFVFLSVLALLTGLVLSAHSQGMFPTQPWQARKDQVSQDSKAERKRRQKLARRDREKRRKANQRDAGACEPDEPDEIEECEALAAAAALGVEEDVPVTGGLSSSSSRRIQELEYELDVRTHAAKADNLIMQRRVDDAELRYLTQKAMATDESSRRMKLEMAAAAQALNDKKELDRARSREARLEDQCAAARTHLASRETALKHLQRKNRDLENSLQIEQDASRRSDRRLVAQVVQEKGKRIALELQLEKQQRKQ